MLDDIRYALRQLYKNPGFALVAVATLALGIGAASAMFGLIQGVLLSPPPYAEPDRLVLIDPARTDGQPYERAADDGGDAGVASGADVRGAGAVWMDVRLPRRGGRQRVGGRHDRHPELLPDARREAAPRPRCSPRRRPRGRRCRRPASSSDTISGAGNSTAIRTSSASRSSSAGAPAPLPIVGVMPPGMRFLPDPARPSEPNYDVNAPVDFWFVTRAGRIAARRRGPGTPSAGCAAPRRSHEAQAEATRHQRRARAHESRAAGPDREGGIRCSEVLNRDGRALLMPLFGSVALVFFIACANVAGLLLARGLQRQQEYTMRAALGAGRARLFRQVITESLVVAFFGAIAGAGLAVGSIAALEGHRRPRDSARRHGDGRLAGAGVRLPRGGRRGRHRGTAARRARVVHRSLPRRERLARERDARRTPPARRGRDAADDPHGRPARRRGAADPHGAESRRASAPATRPRTSSR